MQSKVARAPAYFRKVQKAWQAREEKMCKCDCGRGRKTTSLLIKKKVTQLEASFFTYNLKIWEISILPLEESAVVTAISSGLVTYPLWLVWHIPLSFSYISIFHYFLYSIIFYISIFYIPLFSIFLFPIFHYSYIPREKILKSFSSRWGKRAGCCETWCTS